MEQSSKSKTGLIAILTLIIGLLIGATGIFFWKDGELSSVRKDLSGKEQKLTTLEQQMAGAPKGLELDDRQVLKMLTEEQVAGSDVADYWLPIIHSIHQDYASTAPLPVVYSTEYGYEVPAMGGKSFFWHKKDGSWQEIGSCTESGCEMIEGYSYEKLPKELTH